MPDLTTAWDHDGDLSEFLSTYSYQPNLTPKLDSLSQEAFTQEVINEIALWKTDRYVGLQSALLQELDTVKSLRPGEHRKAEGLISRLVEVDGVQIAMASTFLRFRNKAVFQIIDKRAYRVLYGQPFKLKYNDPGVGTYLAYIEKLIEFCREKSLRCEDADRVLYEFDKRKNHAISIN